ncbi:MAG: DUF4411 family protein, partial [Ignavibacteriaceae bacterium]|nr:DUF4411 family protein [Ignavibacteriaceae bacterium]
MQKGRTYIFDNSSLMVLGNYYPKSFQTLWDDMNELVVSGKIFSVKEVRKEIEKNCRFPHIEEWVKKNRKIFRKPSSKELDFI